VVLLAVVVRVAAVAIPARPVLMFSLEPAVLFVIVPWSVSSISIVAAASIRVGVISPALMVIATLTFARGKTVRHAHGEQSRC